jgi:hypothetical protein
MCSWRPGLPTYSSQVLRSQALLPFDGYNDKRYGAGLCARVCLILASTCVCTAQLCSRRQTVLSHSLSVCYFVQSRAVYVARLFGPMPRLCGPTVRLRGACLQPASMCLMCICYNPVYLSRLLVARE